MPTQLLPTRTSTPATNPASLSRGLLLALALHATVAIGLLTYAFITHNRSHWGDQDPTAGSIQASMVSALPLPPRQPFRDKAVLASDNPSPAPTPPPPAPAKSPTKSAPPQPRAPTKSSSPPSSRPKSP